MSKSINNFSIQSLGVIPGNYYNTYGIILKFKGTKPKNCKINFHDTTIDFHGDIWHNLPQTHRNLVRWYLPIELNQDYLKNLTFKNSELREFEDFEFEIHLGTNYNQFGILAQGITDYLSCLSNKGDPTIEILISKFDYFSGSQIFSLYTKPSQVLISMKNSGSNCLFAGEIVSINRSEKKPLWPFFKWFLSPFVLSILLCLSFYFPKEIVNQILPINQIYNEFDNFTSFPKTLLQSWEIAFLDDIYWEAKSNSQNAIMLDILKNASKILQLDYDMNESEFIGIKKRMLNYEMNPFSLSQIYDLTFLDILILLAYIVIGITFIPCIYYLLYPYHKKLIRITEYIWRKIIIPFHISGLYSLIWMSLSIIVLLNGVTCPNYSGYLVSFLGLVSFTCAFFYNLLYFCPFLPTRNLYVLNCLWVILIYITFSVHYKSLFLCIVSIVASYISFFLSQPFQRLEYSYRHSTYYIVILFGAPCSFIILLFIIVKFLNLFPEFINLYLSPMIFSSLTLINILLYTVSSSIFTYSYTKTDYIARQIPIVSSIIISLLTGIIYKSVWLTRLSVFFFIIFILLKYWDYYNIRNKNGWVLLFIASIIGLIFSFLVEKYGI